MLFQYFKRPGRYHCIILLFLILGILSCDRNGNKAVSRLESLSIPSGIQQLLLVTTPSWDDFRGTLVLYSQTRDGWKIDGERIPVVIGRNGLAWGRGIFKTDEAGPQKIEGDGRAPAGIFELGTAFGYDPDPPSRTFPYRQATQHDYFIDDPSSEDYNQWVSLADSTDTDPNQYWKSFEKMKRDDELYEFGIVVKHNMNPVFQGKGSAIFLHVWRDSDQPTAGCTAMSKRNLLKVIRWLDRSKNTILIQVPEEELMNSFLRISR